MKLYGRFKNNRIDFGDVAINESYEANSPKEIINNNSKVYDLKKIQNYLISLKKIDRKLEPNKIFIKLSSFILNNLLDNLYLVDIFLFFLNQNN